MTDDLDSLVKGAPLSSSAASGQGVGLGNIGGVGGIGGIDGSLGSIGSHGGLGPIGGPGSIAASTSAKAGDPLSHTPSSPSMIYLNLLVLEASLRAQYLALRARRRHHTFFLLLLSAWVLGFGYALFLAPREDGSGVGGSVYWVVDVLEKVCFMGGVITAILIWATGIWERGVRWPRRWFSVSNRGLRHINCKLVLLKRPWWAETLFTLAWFLTYGLLSDDPSFCYRHVEPATLREVDRELQLSASGHPVLSTGADDEKPGPSGRLHHTHPQHAQHAQHHYAHHPSGHEEDLSPGGDYVKLLLLAKPFSPTFRENWELYRQEYWERENERRALLRRKLQEQDRDRRRRAGGWFWWLPWGAVPAAADAPSHQPQQPPLGPRPQHPRHAAVEREHREHRRARSSSSRRGSMSLSGAGGGGGELPSSSSSMLSVETDEPVAAAPAGRKVSTGSMSSSEPRRKKASVAGSGGPRASTAGTRRPTSDSRSVTPEIPSPLARENSLSSG